MSLRLFAPTINHRTSDPMPLPKKAPFFRRVRRGGQSVRIGKVATHTSFRYVVRKIV